MSKEKSLLTDGQIDAQKRMKKKKRKKIIKIIIIVLLIAAILVFSLFKFGFLGKNNTVSASKLTTYTVGTRSITKVLTSSGTIEPNDQYTINALVIGEILGDYFEEGDTVIEDQLLYTINSENLDSSVTRAENSLKNANKALNKALENLENLNVESEITGTIKKLHVEVGDEINSGTLIADVIDNETMCIDIPFMESDCINISVGDTATVTFDTYEETLGTVTEISPVSYVNSLGVKVKTVTISVKNMGSITTSTKAFARVGEAYCTADAVFYNNDEGQIFAKTAGEVTKVYYEEGDKIYDGNIIVRLESEDLEDQIEKLRDTVNEAEDSLEDANDAFDNYNIEAPITGKVISKSYKTGDTLSGGQGNSSTLAVIYDMSALKFTMSIDELDIDKLDKGQDVIITCDSREGEEYHGTITNISIQGTTSNGTTVYPVEVTLYNVEDIDKRTVGDDGTVNKVYKTGMTSTETTYTLISANNTADGILYTYSDDLSILRKNDSTLYDGEKQLKEYLGGTYTQGSSFYSFSDDFTSLVLEIQNDKKMLRPGMNIDAQIVVESRENVVAVPLTAVGRGNVVKVLKNTSAETNETDMSDESKETNKQKEKPNGFTGENMPGGMPESNVNFAPEGSSGERQSSGTDGEGRIPASRNNQGKSGYGTADIDSEYDEIRVTVGISDDDYVEITSGLNVCDVVVVDTANLASANNAVFGMMGGNMMGGGMMGGGMPSAGMMGGGSRPSGMGGGPMGR